MKPCSATGRRNLAATIAVVAFAGLFGVVMAGTSLAQDTSKDVTSWDALDGVLELPPVFLPDPAANAESEPTDTCAEDCSSSSDPDDSQSSAALASIGSAQEYEAQAAAEELGTSGMVQVPIVIIGAPIGPYYLLSSARMWQPMARVVMLPSIVPHGLPRPMAAFSGGGLRGFRGGFSGFHGGFGRR
jgi:hypothetical protein